MMFQGLSIFIFMMASTCADMMMDNHNNAAMMIDNHNNIAMAIDKLRCPFKFNTDNVDCQITVTDELNREKVQEILIGKKSLRDFADQMSTHHFAQARDQLNLRYQRAESDTNKQVKWQEELLGKKKRSELVDAWLDHVSHLRKNVSGNVSDFRDEWYNVLDLNRTVKDGQHVVLPQDLALRMMGLSNSFSRLFWPFRHDVNKANQQLALNAINPDIDLTTVTDLKSNFFRQLQRIQPVELPVKENEIVFSFEHDDLARWMNKKGLLNNSPNFMATRQYIFSKEEIQRITSTANEAMVMINMTHPDLYKSITQMLACISFYKCETKVNIGANMHAAMGMIWLDPSVGEEWSVPFMAEQIVHEYTHNVLNYVEFVHGIYNQENLIGAPLVMSAIRRVPRPYDKALHAAYVSSGLITFHTRTGYLARAAQLADSFPVSVKDLNDVNAEADVLNRSGNAMLKFLSDFMYLTGL